MTLFKPGHVYKRFTLTNGKKVTVRVLRWEDLDALLQFINTLVNEKQGNTKTALYTGFDKRVTREQEADWLAQTLVAIDGDIAINMVADIDGKIVANGDVTRSRYTNTHNHGHLGLTMISEYRGQGIGHRMIEMLVRESRKSGLRTLETEFLAENARARRAYEKAGFRQAGIIPHKVFRSGRYFDGLVMAIEL